MLAAIMPRNDDNKASSRRNPLLLFPLRVFLNTKEYTAIKMTNTTVSDT
jgi:hypothetical protein